MIRQAAESTLSYASTGDQQSVALQMRGLVDDNVSDPYQQRRLPARPGRLT
jgi:hypothetical protein